MPIIAGNWGSGKRGGGVSTLICAVRDDRQPDSDDEEPKCTFKYFSFMHLTKKLPGTVHSFE